MRDDDRTARVRRSFVKFEIYYEEDHDVHRWRLLASDGQLMATSKAHYPCREAVWHAVVALQASIPIARIVDAQDPDAARRAS